MKFNEVKLKYIAHLNPSKSEIDLDENKEQVVSFLPMDKIISSNYLDLSLNKTIEEVYSGYTYFRENDIVLAKVTPCFENGNLAIARGLTNEIGFGTTELHVLRVNEKFFDTEYIYYCLQLEDFKSEAVANMYGVGGLKRIPTEFLSEYKFLVPDLDTQIRIRKYLNLKLNEISSLIGNKTKLIKLLEQQRQSIITEAVTKGLNPNVKMKDSGVEWIGEIPEHWEVKKVKHFATHVGSGKTPSGGSEVYLDEGVPFLRSLNVHFDGIRLKDLAFISEETNAEMKSSQVQPLDILLNITGASIGRTAIVPKDFGRANVNQHVCIIRLNQKKMYPYYFNMLMSSDVINQQIWFAQNGSSREGLNFVQVKELTFAVPPTLEEQREINEWVFNKQQAIYDVMSTIKEQIDKLKEYRQALIYEAVTGKIDVRDMELD